MAPPLTCLQYWRSLPSLAKDVLIARIYRISISASKKFAMRQLRQQSFWKSLRTPTAPSNPMSEIEKVSMGFLTTVHCGISQPISSLQLHISGRKNERIHTRGRFTGDVSDPYEILVFYSVLQRPPLPPRNSKLKVLTGQKLFQLIRTKLRRFVANT